MKPRNSPEFTLCSDVSRIKSCGSDQCCGSGMFIPDPNFSIADPDPNFSIPDPKRSRVEKVQDPGFPDPQQRI